MPLLANLAGYYMYKSEDAVAAALLEWYLEIAANHGLDNSDEAREALAELITVLFRLNHDRKAEALLKGALLLKTVNDD